MKKILLFVALFCGIASYAQDYTQHNKTSVRRKQNYIFPTDSTDFHRENNTITNISFANCSKLLQIRDSN